MKFKLKITNENNSKHKIKVLFGIANKKSDNFELPDGIKVELIHKEYIYKNLMDYLNVRTVFIKFTKSTDNRRLFFLFMDAMGGINPIVPQLEIDGTDREIKRGKGFKLGNDTIFESDIFVNNFKKEWNPKKWNIADTHETVSWGFSNFVDVTIGKKETFELDFILLDR
jgi:hypothetical protein